MIDDVMSAPPFTLFPSSFLHRSFLLLLAGSRGSNPPRAEHRARGTQSSSFPLLPLSPPPSCPLLSSFPLPSPVVNLSLLLRHSQTAHPPLSRTISIRYLSVIPALLGSTVPFGASPTTARKTRFLRDPRKPENVPFPVNYAKSEIGHNPSIMFLSLHHRHVTVIALSKRAIVLDTPPLESLNFRNFIIYIKFSRCES